MSRGRTRSGDDERTSARERAMSLLYEAEQRQMTAREILDSQPVTPDDLVVALVEGVGTHQAELDEMVSAHLQGWTLARLPAIDRTVLRMATFELLHRPDVPVAVVLDEAVELAKRYSTDDSNRYVNGVLSALVPDTRPT
jgi:transcription antitermination protein NusB